MKPKFLLFVVIIAAFIAYQKMPGLKAKAENLANKYGGWTSEAIEKNPGEFIDHARQKLQANIATFEEAKKTLSTNKRNYESKLEEFKTAVQNADTLAANFKSAYSAAKANEGFPIELVGQKYSEEKVVAQVELLLAEKANAQKRIADYESLIAQVETKRTQLTDRISTSKAKVDELEVKAEAVKLDKATALADELLAQVNSVVEDNGKALDADSGDPVRSLADMVKDIEKKAADAPSAAPKSDALAFLNN